jgi:hypothetical protein
LADALDLALAADGFFVVEAGAIPVATWSAPWAFAERVTGQRPSMVERQIIRAVPGGRSFASSNGHTPLHNDLQLFRGRPADLQILACLTPASEGGTSLLLDTWPLVESLASAAPSLFDALFDRMRHLPFIAGAIESPTIGRFDDRVAFLHAPRPSPRDELFEPISRWLRKASARALDVRQGQVLVVDNHRVLHGRTAFADVKRELVRLLVWLDAPRPVPPQIHARSSAVRIPPRPLDGGPTTEHEIGLVVQMLEGASPGWLARRYDLPEPRLYALRDALYEIALERVALDR